MTFEIHFSAEASREAHALNVRQRRKLDWWVKRLETDLTVGDHIRADLIPKRLRAKYNLVNLWRLELPGGWRVLYSLNSRFGDQSRANIIRILNHKEYDRLFGYSTS